jgi:HK97 family phage major capsid protein
MNTSEIRRQLEEARTNRERLFGERENLLAREQVDGASDGVEERIANLNRALASADDRIQDLEAQYGRVAYLERAAGDPRHREAGAPPADEHRDTQPRVERHADAMDAEAADRIDRLIRKDERSDWTSRYVAAVGSEAYRSAFVKLMQDPQHGHLRYSAEEVDAMRVVGAIEAERAMSIGSGAGGGFLLPFALDPSIMLSSNGALNPVRQLARVVTTPWNEWRGVSSDGVTVSYSAEAATMVDGSPVLVQPVITCRRWTAFVPFSWELGQDWPDLQNELVRLIADGRDVNDTTVFYSGTSSSNQPSGIMTGLSATQGVLTVGTATLTATDWWALKAAIPPRFTPNTTFAAPSPLFDRTFRLTPSGGTTEPPLMPTRDGALMGRPIAEWSFNAGTATPTSGTLAIGGDFRAGYVIADRLGLTAVPIPTLFGGTAAVHYPTGESGLAVWGRTGGGVVNANAFRVLLGR